MEENKTIIINDGEAEWYTDCYTCASCNEDFMTDKPNYCPCCGKKIRIFNFQCGFKKTNHRTLAK